MSDMPIRVVLDTTAMIKYGSGNVAVGEIIAELSEEEVGFAVPDVCLIDAARQLDADDWPALGLLLTHPQCVRLELPPNWRDVAAAAQMLGTTGRAVAMLASVDHRAYLLTAEPEAFGGDDALLVIEV